MTRSLTRTSIRSSRPSVNATASAGEPATRTGYPARSRVETTKPRTTGSSSTTRTVAELGAGVLSVVWYVTGPDSSAVRTLDLHISLTKPGDYVVQMSVERAGVSIMWANPVYVTVP